MGFQVTSRHLSTNPNVSPIDIGEWSQRFALGRVPEVYVSAKERALNTRRETLLMALCFESEWK
jgi:hypothetical protein